MRKIIKYCNILIVMTFLFFGCYEEQKESTTKGNLLINIDESIAPVMNDVVIEFEKLYTEAKIGKEVVSAREAIANLINEKVGLILISRELNKEERDAFDRYGVKIYSYNIARDGLVLFVNKENSLRQIDLEDLRKIITGEIENWKDVKTSSVSGKIQVFGEDRNSGSYVYMKNNVLKGEEFNKSFYPCSTSSQVIENVSKSPGSIGWVGLSWKPGENKSVRILEVAAFDSTSIVQNYFEPHQAHIHRRYYPLTRNLYVYSRDMGSSNVSAGLVAYLTHEGQKVILNKGLVPAVYPVRLIQFGN
jgi:phosphate transport system substrate-binding protein